MKKNMIFKILIISIIFLITIFSFVGRTYATESIIRGADDFLKQGDQSVFDMGEVRVTSKTVFRIFYVVGIVIVVIVGSVLGIQLMMAAAEEKAKIMEMLIPYIVGSIIIVAAYPIWSLVVNITQNIG